MRTFFSPRGLAPGIVAFLCFFVDPAGRVNAAIEASGDVSPNPPGEDSWVLDEFPRYLFVGDAAPGALSITDPGRVEAERVILGGQLSGQGVLTVAGRDSSLLAESYLWIGREGDGVALFTDGAAVESNRGSIADLDDATGRAVVSTGATWTNERTLWVGRLGDGTLHVEQGGIVRTGSLTMGSSAGGMRGSGVLVVDGPGSLVEVDGALDVGSRSRGVVTIQGGGAVRVPGGLLRIGNFSSLNASVSVEGVDSTLDVVGNVIVGNSEAGGVLSVVEGADASVDNLTLRPSGRLQVFSGGKVEVALDTVLESGSNGAGRVTLDDGELHTGGFVGSFDQLEGVGVVRANGLVTDNDLQLVSPDSLMSEVHLTGQQRNIRFHLDLTDPSRVGALGAGYTTNGSLDLTGGVIVESESGRLGVEAGSHGITSISGRHTEWRVRDRFTVGEAGQATLSVEDQAALVIDADLVASDKADSRIRVGPNAALTVGRDLQLEVGEGSNTLDLGGGLVTAHTLIAAPEQLSGSGRIAARGLVSDIDLSLSTPASRNQSLPQSTAGGGVVTIELSLPDAADNGALGVGYEGAAELSITGGIQVTSREGMLGYYAGASGSASVSGDGTVWDIDSDLTIGRQGSGDLVVSNGGVVTARDVWLHRVGKTTDSRRYATVRLIGPGTLLDAGSRYSASSGDSSSTEVLDGAALRSRSVALVGGRESVFRVSGSNSRVETDRFSTWHVNSPDANLVLVEANGRLEANRIELLGDRFGLSPTDPAPDQLVVQGEGTRVETDTLVLGTQSSRAFLAVRDRGVLAFRELFVEGSSVVFLASGGTIERRGVAVQTQSDFLDRVYGTDDFRYWNGTAWAPLVEAIDGADFRVVSGSDAAGVYSRLTVFAVPEPATAIGTLLVAAGAAASRGRRD